ncbi:DUF4232 domain-containing protein [Streptomyces daghestanicus]|uniref:DUF4232 domain-containing protein n=1 Tax=Streptomyces daghestanicus TaxID=66885 RepID=A0ABQ3Q385_9ACTN|nr:DUF4232 domain-containing protein [Streptomyces daghestanicus]GGU50747.1 hypothetical protein GCM10010259_47450 [Streptomyces daghestanicus]GHI31726.1 hypothetical protein Sdagh_34560 [Streptomyces daghestanicus]
MSARTTRVRLFAAATVALAALSLTACEDGSATGVRDSSTAPVAAEQSARPEQKDQRDQQAGGTDTTATTARDGSSTTGSQAAPDGDGGDELPGDCSAEDVEITATEVPRPINHLLLTATNTGAKTCALPAYPAARFGEAQSVPPVVETSKPQSLTMLEPGGSGYAGVLLSAGDGSAGNGSTVTSLTVPFDDGSVATVGLPADGVYVDDSLKVTYWLTDRSTALTY